MLAAIIGALVGVAFGYLFQNRVERKKRIAEAVFRALALARQYQYDVLAFGEAFVRTGVAPKPLPEEDPETVRHFALDHGFKRFADAERQLLETEKELRLVAASLAFNTPLHRHPGETVSFFDIIVDEMCGQLAREMISESSSAAQVNDTVFRYGVILAGFEKEAATFLQEQVDRRIRVPESRTIGEPIGASDGATQQQSVRDA